ncbi:MAG: peptidoglycan editing factor PgeF, partial [Paramuribaculum sp.]|nr:peptidoglycan editing factor PgeF [Paramuribaculum sp.]
MRVTELIDAAGITAFSSLRANDSPESPYAGFNTCDYTGDDAGHIAECRAELARKLGIDLRSIYFPLQTHSVNVAVIDGSDVDLEGVDALVTTLPGVALAIHTADCVPVVLADPVAGVIGAAHSGWRGTVGNIAAKTVEAMNRLGAEPERMVAAMGPCICADCFEVGEEVAEKFEGMGCVLRTYERPHVNLPEAVALGLTAAGVPRRNIVMPPACSRCNPHDYFSARRLGGNSRRTRTVIL